MEWDPEFEAVFTEVLQSKVGRFKLIAFVAGADRHMCFFLALADYMISRPPPIYNSDTPAWLIPELHVTSTPAQKLGLYLKDLLPRLRGGAASFSKVAVVVLPDDVSAAGVRPGASNTLAKWMPGELIAHVTGHELKGTSALYEYIDASRALAIPGALVLAGWPALPWGQHGAGPSPPSLDALRDVQAPFQKVDMGRLEAVIDALFNIDSRSPPMLGSLQTHPARGSEGALRPMLRAALAALLMYYDVRIEAGEMQHVHVELHRVLNETYGPTDGARAGVPVSTIKRWGALIKAKFERDNLHLRTKAADAGMGSVVQVVQQVAQSMSDMQNEVNQLRGVLASLVEDKLERVTRSLERMGVAASPIRPSAATPAAATNSGAAATLLSSLSGAAATPLSSLSPDASDQGLILVRAHVHDDSQRPAPMELKGASAGEFYKNVMGRGGGVPVGLSDQDKGRVRLLLAWFNAMANEEEKKLLLPAKAGCVRPDEGERREAAARLHALVVARMAAAFCQRGQEVPPALSKGTLPATAIQDRVGQLKKPDADKTPVTVITNWEAFQTWRQANEQEAAQAAAALGVEPAAKRARPA